MSLWILCVSASWAVTYYCFQQIWKGWCQPRTTSEWRLYTKTTTRHGKMRSTPPWSNWWWVWVSYHHFHFCTQRENNRKPYPLQPSLYSQIMNANYLWDSINSTSLGHKSNLLNNGTGLRCVDVLYMLWSMHCVGLYLENWPTLFLPVREKATVRRSFFNCALCLSIKKPCLIFWDDISSALWKGPGEQGYGFSKGLWLYY